MTELSIGQYQLVSNFFSLTIAAMGAATAFLWINRSQVADQYKTALTVSGLVTFIALYHYWRIYASWEDAYNIVDGVLVASGKEFNPAYRYVDWLLTVPLLLIELILVMKLSASETVSKSVKLGGLAALMIILGYPGEISDAAGTRWLWWSLSMIPFIVIVYELFIGLKASQASQPEEAQGLIGMARYLVIISWSFYPIVFIFPMLGISGGTATTIVEVGYSISDIVAKAVFGVLIFMIAVKKTEADKRLASS
ncbi:MAG: bacteriorhodopsin-like [Verrucomicrobiota bacterium]